MLLPMPRSLFISLCLYLSSFLFLSPPVFLSNSTSPFYESCRELDPPSLFYCVIWNCWKSQSFLANWNSHVMVEITVLWNPSIIPNVWPHLQSTYAWITKWPWKCVSHLISRGNERILTTDDINFIEQPLIWIGIFQSTNKLQFE